MSLMKTLLGIKTWFDPRLLPNRLDYRFIAKVAMNPNGNYSEVECVTYKTEFAIRFAVKVVSIDLPVKFHDIISWREV